MQDVYKNIDEYNIDRARRQSQSKGCKILIAFVDMIADIINNKKTKFNSD